MTVKYISDNVQVVGNVELELGCYNDERRKERGGRTLERG